MYSAEIIVNGVKGYVGGNDATDLADGVEACAEAIENAIGKNTQNAYDDDDDWDNIDHYILSLWTNP